MKIPDVNILIYAHDSSSPFHHRAKKWLEEALSDKTEPVAIAPSAALGFVRLICNPRVCERPLSVTQACTVVQAWFESGAIWLETKPDHFDNVSRLLTDSHAGVAMLTDAHLAALAIEHRGTLFSNDRDFGRFKGLKVKNPVD